MLRRLFMGWRGRLVVAMVVALGLAGAALAYYTSTGSGSGGAQVGDAQALLISSDVAPGTALFPGGSGDVTVRVENPNTFKIHINQIALDTARGEGNSGFDASPAGCNLTSVPPALTFSTQDNGANGWDVDPKVGSTNGFREFDFANSVHMNVNAVNACQGATFTVYLTVGP